MLVMFCEPLCGLFAFAKYADSLSDRFEPLMPLNIFLKPLHIWFELARILSTKSLLESQRQDIGVY